MPLVIVPAATSVVILAPSATALTPDFVILPVTSTVSFAISSIAIPNIPNIPFNNGFIASTNWFKV